MAVHIVQDVTATCDTPAELTALVDYLTDRAATVGDVGSPLSSGLSVTFRLELHIAPPQE